MNYFSRLNSFATTPANMQDFTIDQLQLILDITIMFTHSFLMAQGVVKNPSVRGYLSCCFGYNEENLVIGLTDDKTVPGAAFLLNLKKEVCEDVSSERIEELIKDCGELEFGVKLKWFTKFSFKTIFSNELFWNEVSTVDNSMDVMDMIGRNTEYESLLIEFNRAGTKLADSIIEKERNRMNFNPIFKARNLTVDENMVFCVLPFNDERLEIFDEVLKPKLEEEFGLTVVRSGNIFEPNQNLTETIWTYINQSKFVLADISDKNANVFYELGICHTIGKPVISICDEESLQEDYEGKLPFDIGAINTIFYKNKGTGMEKLFESIKLNIQSIIEGRPIIK
ncbi:hypothetical protein [Vagococcus fluvialis]|uniref:hypothetical protein n=1 Tax=Vagococcus fluvialis TaxID=2738 RepID=UPI0022E80709|nr:hypothetical protein [Vagococcus fluvialis]